MAGAVLSGRVLMSTLLDMSPQQLCAVKRFAVEDLPMGPHQRFTVFRRPNLKHNYVVGADFAHGMSDGDFDAAQVFDRNTTPWEQVAVLQGRWGETRFHKLLYALLRLYNGAFLIGERQVGLATMRHLVDDYGYLYMYFEKDETKGHKPITDRLGHATGENDITLTDLRRVIRDNPKNPQLLIYDGPTLLEIEKMQWQARGAKTQQMMLAGRLTVPDNQLKAGAPPKLHDDLVISTALALKGLGCVDAFLEQKPKYEPGTMGALDDPDEIFKKQEEERAGAGDRGVFNRFLRG
jgi:hypothetical protein